MRVHRLGAVPILPALLGVHLMACTSWQVQQASPAKVISEKHPDVVRVTRADQSRVVLRHPVVRGDTLVGAAKSSAEEDSLSVPVDRIRILETRHLDGAASVAGILGIAAASVATFLIVCSGECLER